MFERFTDRARRAVVQAQAEAVALDHDHVGPEHLLLGLIHEASGLAAKTLESLGISLDTVRERVETAIGRGEQPPPAGRTPFTEEAKDVLQLSLLESRDLGQDYIGTEHILLGVIRQGEGVAARVLTDLGADLDRTRAEVARLLEEYLRSGGQTS